MSTCRAVIVWPFVRTGIVKRWFEVSMGVAAGGNGGTRSSPRFKILGGTSPEIAISNENVLNINKNLNVSNIFKTK